MKTTTSVGAMVTVAAVARLTTEEKAAAAGAVVAQSVAEAVAEAVAEEVAEEVVEVMRHMIPGPSGASFARPSTTTADKQPSLKCSTSCTNDGRRHALVWAPDSTSTRTALAAGAVWAMGPPGAAMDRGSNGYVWLLMGLSQSQLV
jgi:hypothetical protein